jgi:hypothetical protein
MYCAVEGWSLDVPANLRSNQKLRSRPPEGFTLLRWCSLALCSGAKRELPVVAREKTKLHWWRGQSVKALTAMHLRASRLAF